MDTLKKIEEDEVHPDDAHLPSRDEWDAHIGEWISGLYKNMMETKLEDVHKDPHPPAGSTESQEEWDASKKNAKWNYWCSINPHGYGVKPTPEEWSKIPDFTSIAIGRPTFREDAIRSRKYGKQWEEEMEIAMNSPMPNPDIPDTRDYEQYIWPEKFEYVSGKTLMWEKHRDEENGVYYSHPDEPYWPRPKLLKEHFFISKMPESMDKLFSSDGTADGGIPCVQDADGFWVRGEAPRANEAAGNQHDKKT